MTRSIDEDVAAIGRIDVVPQILEVICRTTGMGFAAVARVTDDRWVACAVRDEIEFGLVPGGELQVETTICHEIRRAGRPVVINHVSQNPAFANHPTPKMYGFQSYISVPINTEGQFFGTLCAIDPRPAQVETPEIVGMFNLFADLIARHLQIESQLATSEAALLSERQAVELREQFIAVLGHDLRNPLAAIQGAGRLLLKSPLDDKALTMVGHVQSSVSRMAALIDNLMDFARARLGGGFEIAAKPDEALAGVIVETIDEVRLANPGRTIVADVQVPRPVVCDSSRIAQLLSNLLSNAVAHGDEHSPITVRTDIEGEVFKLTVENQGEPIPPEARARLFEPFTRAEHGRGKQGLGLGLYIASEIARGHGGRLSVETDGRESRFNLTMPVSRDQAWGLGLS